MTEQVWQFGGIEGSAVDFHGASASTAGLLDEGSASLARLRGAWHGDAQTAYDAVQSHWNSAAAELNAALQNLAHTISDAGMTMAQTEAGVTGMFA